MRVPLHFVVCNYSIHVSIPSSVINIRDLRVIFSSNLSSTSHITNVTSTALKTLGFIYRSSKLFQNVYTLRLLYRALARTHLGYCSIIWAHYHHYLINNLATYGTQIPTFSCTLSRLSDVLRRSRLFANLEPFKSQDAWS